MKNYDLEVVWKWNDVVLFFICLQRNTVTEASPLEKSEEFYKAVWSTFLCLDALTSDLLLTPVDVGEDDGQLRLLQREVCPLLE